MSKKTKFGKSSQKTSEKRFFKRSRSNGTTERFCDMLADIDDLKRFQHARTGWYGIWPDTSVESSDAT